MKQFFSFFVLLILFFSWVGAAHAKLLPQLTKRTAGKAIIQRASSGITISPRLRSDRRALVVSFSNLQNAASVSYTLTYQTNGQQEGAGGAVNPSEANATRELLFATCSSGVCRYHSNIKNMKFEVNYRLTNGKKYLKRYRIKI